jgi:hypothetical protein
VFLDKEAAMRKRKKFLVCLITVLFFSTGSRLAFGWQEGSSAWPVPPNTEEAKSEQRTWAGEDIDFVYYTSDLEAEMIRGFYRKALAGSGWREKKLVEEMKKIAEVKLDEQTMQTLGQNLIFTKGSAQLMLNFLPAELSPPDKKTRYTLYYGGNLGNLPDYSGEEVALPALTAKPKKEVTPLYPGASLLRLKESEDTLRADYLAQEPAEAVIAFYQEQMPEYGWQLVQERPLEKLTQKELTLPPAKENCPSCAESLSGQLKSVETGTAELNFINEAGDACSLVFSSVKVDKENAPATQMTAILVNYEKKKD